MMASTTSAAAASGAFASAAAKPRGSVACARVVAAGGRRRSGVVRCDADVEPQAQAAANGQHRGARAVQDLRRPITEMATSAGAATLPAAAAPADWRRATASAFLPSGRGRRATRVLRCRAGPDNLGIPGKLAQLWEAARGASLGTMLAAAAAAVVIYKVASDLLAPPPPPPRRREEPVEAALPAPEPVQMGEITEEELRRFDGSDTDKPLLMAIKGQIYDVSQSRMFYGPGGPYELFAGKDASRALAKMSFEPQDLTDDISGLGPFELSALQDWEYKFSSKYVKVGTIKKLVLFELGDYSTSSAVQKEATAAEDKAP